MTTGLVMTHDDAGIDAIRFGERLRWLCHRVGMTQEALSVLSGFDRSYVSRLVAGTRCPSRRTVLRLADALELCPQERDVLLMDAGYMPLDIRSLIDSEPVIGELVALLEDRMVTDEVRADVRNMVSTIVRQARRVPPARIEVLP